MFFCLSSDNYARPKVVLTVLCGYIAILILIVHIDDLKKIENYKKELTDVRMPTFLLLNIATMAVASFGFGRPFCAFFVSFVGLVVIAIEVKPCPGLIEWTEKLFVIVSSLSVVGEYFFVGIKHQLKTNNTNEIHFFFYTLAFVGSIFLFVLYLLFRSS